MNGYKTIKLVLESFNFQTCLFYCRKFGLLFGALL